VKFSVRDFRSEEIETLWRIDQQCFEPGISYSRLELVTYLRRPGAFALVADSSGPAGKDVPVGFIVAEAGRRGNGHIITIDVLPEVRRAGLGSQMLQAAEDRLLAAHCRAVVLETAVDNESALSFYKRHHYSVIKTWPRYYSNGVDAFVLKKDLLSPTEPANLPQ
jgi:[ribosomal protein S18]-alanine N-acetyltransferase